MQHAIKLFTEFLAGRALPVGLVLGASSFTLSFGSGLQEGTSYDIAFMAVMLSAGVAWTGARRVLRAAWALPEPLRHQAPVAAAWLAAIGAALPSALAAEFLGAPRPSLHHLLTGTLHVAALLAVTAQLLHPVSPRVWPWIGLTLLAPAIAPEPARVLVDPRAWFATESQGPSSLLAPMALLLAHSALPASRPGALGELR